ncbi:hypothetical protein D9619_011269 [Psilocybe cf. subviscida]|uniref:Uncharacterized protein n=1 Tax=Psilocybe cf. subviscida TaxID=2480587 RepID=A0A8H5BKW7_9AGAR|nr:hypothetical protein D9619_011269 [Psilocybe cf. subviscida]
MAGSDASLPLPPGGEDVANGNITANTIAFPPPPPPRSYMTRTEFLAIVTANDRRHKRQAMDRRVTVFHFDSTAAIAATSGIYSHPPPTSISRSISSSGTYSPLNRHNPSLNHHRPATAARTSRPLNPRGESYRIKSKPPVSGSQGLGPSHRLFLNSFIHQSTRVPYVGPVLRLPQPRPAVSSPATSATNNRRFTPPPPVETMSRGMA